MKSFYSALIVAIMIGFSGCTGASDEQGALNRDNPTITLQGDKTITLAVGQFINEPGFTASDVKDGDLTQMVKVTSDLDYRHVGQYTVNYTVKDSDGFIGTAFRIVNITQEGSSSGTYSGFDDSQLGESYDFALYNYNAWVRDDGKSVQQTTHEYDVNRVETTTEVVFQRNKENLTIYEFNNNTIESTDYIGFDNIQSDSDGASTVFQRNIRINETFVDETRNGLRMTCILKERDMILNTADVTGSSVDTYMYSDVLRIQCNRSDGIVSDIYFANGWGEVLSIVQFDDGSTAFSVLDKNSMREVN